MRWQAARLARTIAAAALAVVAAPRARPEDVLALAGSTAAIGSPGSSYGWQLQFLEPLSPLVSGSFSWLNEGHIPGHHRDGAAIQLWLNAPRWYDRAQFKLGLGPYLYFDTQPTAAPPGYADSHGAAGLLTGAVAIDLSPSWFVTVAVNDVFAAGDPNSLGFMVGGGYHFHHREHAYADHDGGSVPVDSYARQQIQLFAGQMIYNELDSHVDHEIGIEYRLSLLRWAEWSATWFYAPGSEDTQRDQLATQLWLVDRMASGRIELSAGLGVYTPLGSMASESAAAPASVSGLAGLRAEWNISPRSSLILSWYRSFTNDDNDRDIITLGYGFRFGGADSAL